MTRIEEKIRILADAAKYDVSCSSSGSKWENWDGIGDASCSGIFHTYTEDGRCVSVFNILLTNPGIYGAQVSKVWRAFLSEDRDTHQARCSTLIDLFRTRKVIFKNYGIRK